MNLWIRHALVCQVQVLLLFFFGNLAVLQPEDPSLVSRHLTTLMLMQLVFNNEFLNFSRCPSLQDVRIVGCSFVHTTKISSQSLKRLRIIFGVFSLSFRTHIHAPNLVSLQLDVYKGRVPVLETMPPLLVGVVTIHDSCADRCICDDCGDYCVESCQGFLQNDGSCVLLQGLSQAEDLGLVSGVETFMFRRDLKWGWAVEASCTQ
ncbi:hypothetical protein SEVIR_8G073715v4 [Setaria viridis]|uniref:Uncharacterized protein n=1 Tax=Setaria viridis TaxID=4556 RepID=A0A4U6TEE0_SETVI|nr:hypothetical protein SEVIR_8G073715v2 [Setaria viridis]